jgi:hypothetical protein
MSTILSKEKSVEKLNILSMTASILLILVVSSNITSFGQIVDQELPRKNIGADSFSEISRGLGNTSNQTVTHSILSLY